MIYKHLYIINVYYIIMELNNTIKEIFNLVLINLVVPTPAQ